MNRDEQVDYETKLKTLQQELNAILAEEEKGRNELKKVFANLGFDLA